MRKTIIEHVHDHAVSTPEKVAVVVPGKETTYKELFHLACGYAAYLKKEGLKKGDVVVAKSSQTLEYVVIYLGVHLAGGGDNFSGKKCIGRHCGFCSPDCVR